MEATGSATRREKAPRCLRSDAPSSPTASAAGSDAQAASALTARANTASAAMRTTSLARSRCRADIPVREGTTRSGLGEGRDFRYIGAVDLFGHWRQPLLVHLQVRRETGSIILRWDARRGRALLVACAPLRAVLRGGRVRPYRGRHRPDARLADQARPRAPATTTAPRRRARDVLLHGVREDERCEWHRQAGQAVTCDPGSAHGQKATSRRAARRRAELDASVLGHGPSHDARGAPRHVCPASRACGSISRPDAVPTAPGTVTNLA